MNGLASYLRMPWTIRREERYDDGHYIALRIAELPGFVVAAATEDRVEAIFWPALEAFLRSYLDDGEVPPVPAAADRRHREPVRVVESPPIVVWDENRRPSVERAEPAVYEGVTEAERIRLPA